MSKFDAIRPFYDTEINAAIRSVIDHPMMEVLMNFTFPEVPNEIWKEQLTKTHSIRDFQCNFIYHSVQKVLEKSAEKLTTSGFEHLEKNTPYLFISNHRDIILDTSLLNACLFDHQLTMTASAIGDNLVKKDFINTLAKLNRNFLVMRGLPPRELLQSSKVMSDYIGQLILRENRSVWIAQREGRTKDGNDATHPGVLKMLAMGAGADDFLDYFKKIKIVPVSISYELDPTDALKLPQMLAEANKVAYVKEEDEDFTNIIRGVLGQKKRIHIHIGKVLNEEIDLIRLQSDNSNRQILALAQEIDIAIIGNYKLWPTNYIAYDIINQTDKFKDLYTSEEKEAFVKRLEERIDASNLQAYNGFLCMYANPVENKLKQEQTQLSVSKD